MKNIKLIFAAGLLLLAAAIVCADDFVVLDRTASDFDTWGAEPYGQQRVVTVISRETGLPATTLETQRQQTRLGYGGLFIANSLASATGRSFDEIVALKNSGHGWGWIAKQNGVKLGPIVSRAHRADQAFRADNGKLTKVKKGEKDKSFADDSGGFKHGNGHGKGYGKAQGMGHGGGHGKGKGKGH
jgi:hypothetical protein